VLGARGPQALRYGAATAYALDVTTLIGYCLGPKVYYLNALQDRRSGGWASGPRDPLSPTPQGETPCTPFGVTPPLRDPGLPGASGGATGPRREGLM